MLILLFCYLLVGLVLLLGRENVRQWLESVDELHAIYFPTTPAWVLGLLLALAFLVFWPLTLRITRQ